MLSFARLRPSTRTHRIHYQRPTKCRYARVDKAAPADYTITPCRQTKSARNLVDSKHTSFYEARSRPPFSRTYIRELRGNPVGLRFRYFRSFRAHHPSYRTLFFLHFALSAPAPGFRGAKPSDRTPVAKNKICSVIASRVKTIHC